jgi:hypothetical protein
VEPTSAPARSLADHYPAFRPAGGFLDAPESWVGAIRPFALLADADVLTVVDDLAAGETVLVRSGSLLHDPSCRREHRRPTYAELLRGARAVSFSIRMIVWPPPAHPKAVAIYPEISSAVFKNQPHLFRPEPYVGMPEVRSPMPDAICTYRPGDGEWSWPTRDLVDFLDFVAIYLAKHAVWVRTGGDDGGLWIGPQASHAARDLVRELNPDGECRCGSGTRYRDCHLQFDRARAAA